MGRTRMAKGGDPVRVPALGAAGVGLGAGQSSGTTVQVEAVLAAPEPGAGVRYTRDLQPAGASTNAPFRVPLALPASGGLTLRAIATDRFGNDGPFAEPPITVETNAPPQIQYSIIRG